MKMLKITILAALVSCGQSVLAMTEDEEMALALEMSRQEANNQRPAARRMTEDEEAMERAMEISRQEAERERQMQQELKDEEAAVAQALAMSIEEDNRARELREQRLRNRNTGKQTKLSEEEELRLAIQQSEKAAAEDEMRRKKREIIRAEVGNVNQRVMELQNKINAPVGSTPQKAPQPRSNNNK
jgi:septal ring factor EnvC (AmiA/AmiB activator)